MSQFAEIRGETSLTTGPELAFAGVGGHLEALGRSEVDSVAAVEQALDRIDATQDTLNAFRCVRREAALEEAAQADRRRAAGERLPLLGVPVAIKDDMDLAGETTAFGCEGSFEPKREDGEVARRLRAAGAVIVGKTNTPEFGQWPMTEGPAFGATRNPWNTDHTPGGSSGGSAAAVAAGLVPAAVGSDGAGSVRIPAAWTHLVGVKPQRGRISTWPEPESFAGLTSFGPLTRTVADAALMLDVLAGGRDGDAHRPPPPAEPYAAAARRDPGRLRIGLSFRIPFSGAPARLDRRVRAAVERIADVLSDLGHDVVESDPAYGLIGASLVPRAAHGLVEWSERVPDRSLLDSRTKHAVALGRRLRHGLPLARSLDGVWSRRVGRVFRDADVLLAPTTARPPLAVGALDGLGVRATENAMIAACPYAWPWNVLGWPGVNVPAGLTEDNLPIGAQLLGRADDEARLLSLAAQLESAERWHERRPPVSA